MLYSIFLTEIAHWRNTWIWHSSASLSSVSKLSIHFLNPVLIDLCSQMLNVINLNKLDSWWIHVLFWNHVRKSSQNPNWGLSNGSVKAPRLLGLWTWWFWCHLLVVYEIITNTKMQFFFLFISIYLVWVMSSMLVSVFGSDGFKNGTQTCPQYCFIHSVHLGSGIGFSCLVPREHGLVYPKNENVD